MGLSTAEPLTRPRQVTSERTWRTDPVPWVAGLFLASFVLQRISVPGLPIPITVPLVIGWMVLAGLFGIVEFNRLRLLLWLASAGGSGLVVLAQVVTITHPYVSVNSWGLWIVVWAPLVVQVRQRDADTYRRFAHSIGLIGMGLAALSLAFIGSQLVGIRYHDWFAAVVPAKLQVPDFIISYPITYGSPIYKSNGWIALEPSFMSFFLGVALVCALLARMKVWQVVFIGAGLLSTVAGSGLALVAVFVPVLALQGKLGMLRRYFVSGGILGALFATTVLGDAILSRVSEAGSDRSSTSLRATLPYVELWPHFISDPLGVFLGYGPGSSSNLVNGAGIVGLLVPNILKVLFDYGMVVGALMVVLMVSTYVRGPSVAFAASFAVSIFVLQGAAQPIILCSFIAYSFWAPATSLITATAPRRNADLAGRA